MKDERKDVLQFKGLDLSTARIHLDPGAAQTDLNGDRRSFGAWRVRAGYARLIAGSASLSDDAGVTDNFNRADGGLGANWSVDTADGDSGSLAIATNAVGISGGSGVATYLIAARYSGSSFDDDQWASVDLSAKDASPNLFVVFARRTAAKLAYAFYVRPGQAGVLALVDYSGVFSAPTVLQNGTIAADVGDTIKIRTYGSNIEALVNGVRSAFAVDKTLTSGLPGHGFINDTLAASNSDRMDNFAAGNTSNIEDVTKVANPPTRTFSFERDDNVVKLMVAHGKQMDEFDTGAPEWTS